MALVKALRKDQYSTDILYHRLDVSFEQLSFQILFAFPCIVHTLAVQDDSGSADDTWQIPATGGKES